MSEFALFEKDRKQTTATLKLLEISGFPYFKGHRTSVGRGFKKYKYTQKIDVSGSRRGRLSWKPGQRSRSIGKIRLQARFAILKMYCFMFL